MLDRAVSTSSGEWYLGVHCRKCKTLIPVFRDLGGGAATAGGRGKLTVACPACGKRRRYRASAVMSFLIGGEPAPQRRDLLSDLRPMLEELKTRAGISGRDVLARVVDLFVEYLSAVPPEQQKAAAIEQYMKALSVLSRGSRDPADGIGQELVATLTLLNRKARRLASH
jgi:phage FluMu protein Com